jgi:hypothetical protein
MRKLKQRAYVAGGLALSATLALSGIAYGQTGQQTITGSVQGTNNASLNVTVEYIPGPDGAVAHATNTLIDLPSETKVSTKAKIKKKGKTKKKKIPTCAPATLEGTTTEQAIAQCGKAQVGEGSAIADVVGTDLNATVTAFNGTPVGGNPTILLHSRVEAASLTTVLIGEIRRGAASAPYGDQLNVPVPPLAGGAAAIQKFGATVQKKILGKVGYITAKNCTDGSFSFRGTFDYSDAPQAVVTHEQPC